MHKMMQAGTHKLFVIKTPNGNTMTGVCSCGKWKSSRTFTLRKINRLFSVHVDGCTGFGKDRLELK